MRKTLSFLNKSISIQEALILKTVALVTYQASPQLSTSDQALVAPLQEHGYKAVAVHWDHPGADWAGFDAVVLRSCWDYHTRPQEFRQWIEHLQHAGVSLYNSADTVLWNMEKTYLRTLAQYGIKTIPTIWATQDAPLELVEVLKTQGWSQAVLKPTVGASADGIQIVTSQTAAQQQASFEALLAVGTVMIQPVIEEILEGELSLIFFGRTLSHAILKRPGQGTIFVNSSYGGSYSTVDVAPHVVETAQHILNVALTLTQETAFLYARVDGVLVEGEFMLMELELIEPGLFLDQAAAQRFAATIESVIKGSL